jgi:glycosyltransferase involved in cell wall biosynthesis
MRPLAWLSVMTIVTTPSALIQLLSRVHPTPLPMALTHWTRRYRSPFPFYLAILAIAKNEAFYIAQWIEYHLLVGVEHFWIADNGSTDNMTAVLAPYLAMGVVTLMSWKGTYQQRPVYQAMIPKLAGVADWVAAIDADEYLVPMEGRSVPAILHLRDDWVGVHVHWLIFGTNGVQKRECGLLMERFPNHTDNEWPDNRLTKLIVKPRYVRVMDIHFAIYHRGRFGHTLCRRRESYAYQSLKRPPCYEGLRLNHYFTRSVEEWNWKLNRGMPVQTVDYNDKLYLTISDSEHDTFVDWAIPLVKQNLRQRGTWDCGP